MSFVKTMLFGPDKPKEQPMPLTGPAKRPEEEMPNAAAMLDLVTNAGGQRGLMQAAPTGKKKNLGVE